MCIRDRSNSAWLSVYSVHCSWVTIPILIFGQLNFFFLFRKFDFYVINIIFPSLTFYVHLNYLHVNFYHIVFLLIYIHFKRTVREISKGVLNEYFSLKPIVSWLLYQYAERNLYNIQTTCNILVPVSYTHLDVYKRQV